MLGIMGVLHQIGMPSGRMPQLLYMHSMTTEARVLDTCSVICHPLTIDHPSKASALKSTDMAQLPFPETTNKKRQQAGVTGGQL